jgi:hypothetical protein
MNAGPAMSKWAHVGPSTNSWRKTAALMAPPERVPALTMWATLLFIASM